MTEHLDFIFKKTRQEELFAGNVNWTKRSRERIFHSSIDILKVKNMVTMGKPGQLWVEDGWTMSFQIVKGQYWRSGLGNWRKCSWRWKEKFVWIGRAGVCLAIHLEQWLPFFSSLSKSYNKVNRVLMFPLWQMEHTKEIVKNYEDAIPRGSIVTQKPKETLNLKTTMKMHSHWDYNASSSLFHSRHF